VKYSITFLVLAVAATLAGAVATSWLVSVLAWYTGFAFALLALAYFRVGPRLLMKRPDGKRSLASWPLLWPYFLLNALSFSLYRISTREPAITLVASNLYLGRRLTGPELRQVAAISWQAVLDLAAEFPEARPLRRLAGYRSLPVLDAAAPSLEQLQSAVQWLRTQVIHGPVLVHCALGHGRSATVVIAYLLAQGSVKDIKEGLALLRLQRAGVALRSGQAALLRQYIQERVISST
jgi:protein-tyrosine phosphatase